MQPQEYLDKVAYITAMQIDPAEGAEPCQVYKSKFDDSYITHVGMESSIAFLAEREITEQLTHGVGFSPKDNKWYGWSHRAIYGFEIGSTCKIGNCHYRAPNEEEELKRAIRFWDDEYHDNTQGTIKKPGLIEITWTYSQETPNKKLRGTTGTMEWGYNPEEFGKGEWTAETIEDAKQMAADFNQGVS